MSGQNGGERVTSPQPQDEAKKQGQLDPSLPVYHLVPAPVLGDVMSILNKLPYEQVYRIMPQLAATPQKQFPDGI